MAIAAAVPGQEDARVGARDDVLRALIDQHFDFVFRSLRRLGVPSEGVEDAMQQVWVVVSRRLDAIEAGRERGFVFGIALRVAADCRRSQRRHPVTSAGSLADEIDPRPGADELIDQRRSRELLDELLQELPIELRAVFVLYELEETPVPEIARTLEIPVGTAASRLRRAREEFRALVKRHRARSAGRSD